jgi:hypothetical protein
VLRANEHDLDGRKWPATKHQFYEPSLEGALDLLLEPASELEEFVLPEREAPAFIPRPQSKWDVSWGKQAAAVEESDASSVGATERKLPERRSNLGYSLLLAAAQDYIGANGADHQSAATFLYPTTPEYRKHLAWALELAGEDEAPFRRKLDRMRPQWDAARQTRKA